ncbi:MAG: GAF and ANTAR domain-containing protein [Janthinobacterium lividum]
MPAPEVLTMVEDYLHDAATRTHARLGDVAGVAITSAVAGGEPVTAGASTTLAEEVDRLQYAIGHGPCLHALRGGGGSYVPDLARDNTWGRYGPEAAALGARSCLSVPVTDGGSGVLGVVKVYSGRVDGLDEEQRRIGREFALEVSGGVGLASTLVATSLELDDRIDAMDTRRTIDLATGLLMGRLGCSPEAAFDLLRRESQNHNVKVHDVAADLLSRPSVPVEGLPVSDQHDARAPRAGAHAPFRRRGETPSRGR